MFSLIITIIAIALVAALALATIFYGKDFIKDGTSRAAMTKTVQEGNQVAAAVELYKADKGSMPTGTSQDIKDALVTGEYLRAWPEGNWDFRNDYAVRTDLNEDACLKINKQIGINSVPACTDSAYAGRSFCCSNP